jgi:REP element-mobilizing transposase RayT
MPRAVFGQNTWSGARGYRRPVLTSGLEARLVQLILQSAALLRHERSRARSDADHVHPLIETDPQAGAGTVRW